jgi:hypothetical protein
MQEGFLLIRQIPTEYCPIKYIPLIVILAYGLIYLKSRALRYALLVMQSDVWYSHPIMNIKY